MDIEQRVIIQRIQKKVREASWTCMCPGCDQKAINTHRLQQKGVLNKVSSSHHYMEIKYKDVMYWFENDEKFPINTLPETP